MPSVSQRECNCKGSHHSGACKRRRGVSSSKGSKGNVPEQKRRAAWRKLHNFSAVDGEAVGDKFIMLACSDGTSIEDPDGLKTFDCLQYLTTREHSTLWGFAFDYDVNQILSGLTITQLARLGLFNTTFYGEFRIQHVPGKIFRITNRDKGRTVTVWDAFNFVHTSFARWLKDWDLASGEHLKFIEDMKELRSTFTFDQVDDIRKYCFLELDYLQAGIKELLERVEKTGIKPRTWHSPGSIAAAALRSNKIMDRRDPNLPDKITEAGKAAYFGGRFETRIIGEVPGPLYHHDINSAYPYGLTQLKCLACGTWENQGSVDLEEPGNLVKITWRPKGPFVKKDKRPAWGPFPVRLSAGSLRYPLVNDEPSWYWSDEIFPALAISNIKVHDVYKYTPGCDHKPFDFIQEMYDTRRQMKLDGDPTEYVYKLILNSCYGKLAQRPRKRGDVVITPALREVLWAGRTTSLCRGQLTGAIAQNPEAIIQLATDGLTSFEELDLPISGDLGAWDTQELDLLMILQSGIYFWRDKGGKVLQRSRGFHPRSMTYRRCLNAWRRDPFAPMVFSSKRFIGYRTALHRGRLDLWRKWVDHNAEIGTNPEPRRETHKMHEGYMISVPVIRAKVALFDELAPDHLKRPLLNAADWDLEQGDGPEGGTI